MNFRVTAADLARTAEDLYDAEKHLRRVEKEHKRTETRLEELKSRLVKASSDSHYQTSAEDITGLGKSIEDAQKEKERLFRQVGKSMARLEDFIDLVHSLGGVSDADEQDD